MSKLLMILKLKMCLHIKTNSDPVTCHWDKTQNLSWQ